MNIELLTYTPNPEEHIANCASTCYDSPSKDLQASRKMISAIVKAGHESCIEHASATFRLKDVSRTLTHELVRHRLFSFSQRSQRYVKENDPSYIIPPAIKDNPPVETVFLELMDKAWKAYKILLDFGIKAEDARFVLPNACSTEIVVSGNFRQYRNFLKLRLSPRAQWEIRQAASIILDKLYEIAPSCFEDLKQGTAIQQT